MTLGYIFGGGISHDPGAGADLYAEFEAMRAAYAQVSQWTGLTLGELRTEPLPEEQEPRQAVGAIRQAVLALGIHDVLAEQGIRPGAVGGLSLGAMTSSCLAGALDRETFFRLLLHSRETPPPAPDARPQGLGLAFVPVDEDHTSYYEPARPGVHLAGDFGKAFDRTKNMLMLAGYHDALETLAAEVPPGTVVVLPGVTAGVHSPLRQEANDFMAPVIAATAFRAPAIPLASCLDERTLTSAEEVRDLFLRNAVTPISMVHLLSGLAAAGTQLGVVIGPAVPEGVLAFPFPVVHVEKPEHIADLTAAIYDLGIDLPVAQGA
jgi:[acyl-carrier-protein] S-malonyltransferase